MIKASLKLLRALTLLAATVALAAQAIAICSNAWLYSVELMPNPRYNGTGDREYLSKHTVSGLWRMCYNDRKYFFYLFNGLLLSLRMYKTTLYFQYNMFPTVKIVLKPKNNCIFSQY